jgi:copper(I)-binding protein
MAFTLALLAAPALAQVRVDDAWTRATAPGAKVGAGYMKITSSAADRLLGASSSAQRASSCTSPRRRAT